MGFVTPELLERGLSQPAAEVEWPARCLLVDLEGAKEIHLELFPEPA
jgi:hypothetical protein